MNKELLLQVADAIENQRTRDRKMAFDMETWGYRLDADEKAEAGHTCGTAACVAGFVTAMKHPVVFRRVIGEGGDPSEMAAKDLGLSDEEANELFLGASSYRLARDSFFFRQAPGLKIINENADLVPDALRWMVATGKIDWFEAFEGVRCVREKSAC